MEKTYALKKHSADWLPWTYEVSTWINGKLSSRANFETRERAMDLIAALANQGYCEA